MNVATVVFADSTVIALALEWASAGLVGPSAWVDTGEVLASATPEDRQRWQAQTIDPVGNVGPYQLLTEYLSGLGPLNDVRIVWARSWSTDRHDGSHAMVETHIGGILGQVGARHLIDVVLPDSLVPSSAPVLIPRWSQFVVIPEDRPAPSESDAGWVHRREASNLHGLLVVAGILGGIQTSPPGLADTISTVSAWSRTIEGGALARRAVTHYLDTTLPDVCAADADGEHFTFFEDDSAAIEQVSDLIQEQGHGALGYTPPVPAVLARAPSVGWREVLGLVWRSFLQLIRSLLGHAQGVRPEESLWDAADLGYRAVTPSHPDRDVDAPEHLVGQPWESVDLRYRDILRRRLAAAAIADGHLPPAPVWSHLTRLACALVDGGDAGDDMPQYVGHGMVVPPWRVGPESGREGETAETLTELDNGWRELRDVNPRSVVVRAVHEVREALLSEPDAVQATDRSILTRTAQRLASEVSATVHTARALQRESLPDLPFEESSLSLIDGLYVDIVARRLRSRLDGDRWAQAALAELSPGDGFDAAIRAARTLAGIGLGVAGVGAAAWGVKGGDLRDALKSLLNWDVPGWGGYLLALVVAAAFLATATRRFHVATMGLLERRARILEIRVKLAERAVDAYAQSRVLEHAARIMGQWHGIFGALFQKADRPPPKGVAAAQPSLPRAIQRLEPVMTPEWLTRVHIAPTLARRGWRWLALQTIVEDAARLDGVTVWRGTHEVTATMQDVLESDGLPGSVLDRVHREIRSGHPWDGWRQAAIADTAAKVADALRSGARPLRPISPTQGPGDGGSHDAKSEVVSTLATEMTVGQIRASLACDGQSPLSPLQFPGELVTEGSWTWPTSISSADADPRSNQALCGVIVRIAGWHHSIKPTSHTEDIGDGGDR